MDDHRQRRRISNAVFVTALLAATTGAAAELPVERLFAAPSLNGTTARGVKPSPDGRSIGYLQPAADDPDASQIWVIPAGGGAPRRLLDSRSLGAAPKEMTEAQMKFLERRHLTQGDGIEYWWDGGARLLVLWNGDLFLVGVDDGKIARLTETPDNERDPHLAPDGRHVSFLRGQDLVIRAIAGGAERKVAADASESISYGSAEFVAQEEMQRFTGSWWSPDGGRIAYTRVDESPIPVVPRISIGKTGTSITNDRFPLTGQPNARVALFITGADGGAPVAVDLGTADFYLYDAAWARDGRTLYVQRQSRDQRRLDLLAVDPATGRSRVIVTETSLTWVDLERDFRPLADGNFLWGSARSGWRHLYLYSAAGKLIRPVTQGAWRIANVTAAAAPDFAPVVAVDEAKGLVYFVASIDTPVEQRLYSLSYRHRDTPHALTPAGGWWTPAMAADHPTGFVAQYSDPRTPPNTAIYDLAGKRLAWLAENRLDASHPYFAYRDNAPAYEFGVIKAADGATLNYALAKPPGFDPARRYPVIVRVYGGPGVQTVRREWQSRSDQLLTQQGYLVFRLDNRGSANRDTAFEHANAGELGGVNTTDQIAGVKFLATLPYVDAARIGMMGWSFGGYITVRTLTTPGSGVRAGAAGGVPSDFRLYDTHYTERFLGTPQDHDAAYAAGALLPRLKNLDGRLFVIHGLSDDNVVLANFTSLVGELQDQGKIFDTAVYPGQSHGFRGAKPLTQLWKSYLAFFARTLAADQK